MRPEAGELIAAHEEALQINAELENLCGVPRPILEAEGALAQALEVAMNAPDLEAYLAELQTMGQDDGCSGWCVPGSCECLTIEAARG